MLLAHELVEGIQNFGVLVRSETNLLGHSSKHYFPKVDSKLLLMHLCALARANVRIHRVTWHFSNNHILPLRVWVKSRLDWTLSLNDDDLFGALFGFELHSLALQVLLQKHLKLGIIHMREH